MRHATFESKLRIKNRQVMVDFRDRIAKWLSSQLSAEKYIKRFEENVEFSSVINVFLTHDVSTHLMQKKH